MVHEYAGPNVPIVYEADWRPIGNLATLPSTTVLSIWATRELAPLLNPRALLAAQQAYRSPALHVARSLAPDGTITLAQTYITLGRPLGRHI